MYAIFAQEELAFDDRGDDTYLRQNPVMDTIGQRVKARRLEMGLTQVQLARKAGMKQSTLSDLERGRNDSTMELINLASALNCRPEWLRTGKGSKMYGLQDADAPMSTEKIGTPIITWEKPEDLPEGEFVIVPRYDVHVAAGNGHVVYDELEHDQGQAYRTSSVRNLATKASNLMTVYAKGESMEPSIYEGDALLVDRGQTTVKDRQVYILRYGYEIRVKRLFMRPDGGLRIVSDNSSAFPEEVITGEEMKHIEIIGRVVERSGRM